MTRRRLALGTRLDCAGAIRCASEAARRNGWAWYVFPGLREDEWAVGALRPQTGTGYRCEPDGRVIAYDGRDEWQIAVVVDGRVAMHEPRRVVSRCPSCEAPTGTDCDECGFLSAERSV